MTRRDPIHRGEVLRHDFMDPFGLSATALATTLGVRRRASVRWFAAGGNHGGHGATFGAVSWH